MVGDDDFIRSMQSQANKGSVNSEQAKLGLITSFCKLVGELRDDGVAGKVSWEFRPNVLFSYENRSEPAFFGLATKKVRYENRRDVYVINLIEQGLNGRKDIIIGVTYGGGLFLEWPVDWRTDRFPRGHHRSPPPVIEYTPFEQILKDHCGLWHRTLVAIDKLTTEGIQLIFDLLEEKQAS